jgi:competence protein ComEA
MNFMLERRQVLLVGGVALAVLVIGLAAVRGSSGGAGSEQGLDAPATLSDEDGLTPVRRSTKVTVDVSGAVRRPGVYRLDQDKRVIDAIARAGGPTRSAMESAINRAALLVDGQQIVLPARGRARSSAAVGPGDGPVSLGTATQSQLEEIDGIGPVTAGKIIEFRDQRGGIASIEELDQISGIGPATLESLRSGLQP